MITQRIDLLTYADIERLVEQKVPESRVLDYKRQLPGGTSDDVKELLADVTSFANASGGHLVFGVTTAKVNGKNTAIPETIVGVGEINAEEVDNRLTSQLSSLIQPRIVGLRVKTIAETGKPTVVVIHIPHSWNAPHMIAKGSAKFYSRTSSGKQPLDVTEIRHAFAMSESVGERIRAFRDERIGGILAGETPVPINPSALLVLHFIPLEAFAERTMVALETLHSVSSGLQPIGSSGWDRRNNLDGLLIFSQPPDGPARGYVQVFRSGVIETVDTRLLRVCGEKKVIPIRPLEEEAINHCNQIVAVMQRLAVASRIIIYVSLLNVRGFSLPGECGFPPDGYLIDREHLLFPDLPVDDLGISAATFLRPAFDLLWQACGERRCPHYDDGGNRSRER